MPGIHPQQFTNNRSSGCLPNHCPIFSTLFHEGTTLLLDYKMNETAYKATKHWMPLLQIFSIDCEQCKTKQRKINFLLALKLFQLWC